MCAQLLNIIYVALSFATSSRLVQVGPGQLLFAVVAALCVRERSWLRALPLQSYNELQIAITNSAWRAPIAAAVIGGLFSVCVYKGQQPASYLSCFASLMQLFVPALQAG